MKSARLIVLLLASTLAVAGATSADAARVHSRIRVATPRATLAPSAAKASSAQADNQLLVRFKGTVTADGLSTVFAAADTSVGAVGVVAGPILSWRVPTGMSRGEFARRLKATGKIAYAEPDYIRHLAGYVPPSYTEPNDPALHDSTTWLLQNYAGTTVEKYPFGKSWWIRDINALEAWQTGYTGPAIIGKYPLRAAGTAAKVGVVDTGFYANHPDAGTNVITGALDGNADMTPEDPSAVPDDLAPTLQGKTAQVSHGSSVAGLIGAAPNNGEGTLGAANDTTVAMYKVYFGGVGISDSDIISAIRQAADDGCKVINLSIEGSEPSQALQEAIDHAWNRGCVVVAASGNGIRGLGTTVSYPAASNHVVAVGSLSLRSDGTTRFRSSFSNYGAALDISAPGTSIWGLTKPGYVDPDFGEAGYRWWDGTSMSSPIVAGGIAWLWRAAPDLTNTEMVSLVTRTADDLGTSGRDNEYGWGALNMQAAYAKLISDYPLLHAPTVTVLSQTDARSVRLGWTAVPGYRVSYTVAVDSIVVTSTSATNVTLPYDTTPGPHTVTVTPRSPRNWADGTESASVSISPGESVPVVVSLRYYRGSLLWSDSEVGRTHTDLLSIDGGPATSVAHGAASTSGLSLGSHTASLTVRDEAGEYSQPATCTFTVRPAPSVKRITGTSSYSFATALSRSGSTAATTAVLVGNRSWMDAVVAAPLAHVVRGPVLVSSRTTLPASTRRELVRLGVKKIIIVGDTRDVATSVRRYLSSKRYSVSRISGSDRYQTANAVARALARRTGGTVPGGKVVVVGNSYTYALAASAVAARKDWPLVFTRATGVPSSTRSTLSSVGASSSLVVGGTMTVSNAAMSQLPSPVRIKGASSTAVPTALATWATTHYPADFSGERIYLASSSAWSNGLGLPAQAATRGGLILVTGTTLASPVRSYYQTNSEVAVTTRAIASSSAIGGSALTTIKSIVGAP